MPPSTNAPGVWERLIDPAAHQELAGVLARDRVADVRESIRLELSRLLNARRVCVTWPDSFTELDRSAVSYGLPDFTAANVLSSDDRESLRSEIERTVRVFEPRLSNVRVDLIDPERRSKRSVTLRIDARLRLDGRNESVAYESRLDASKGSFDVKVSEA